MNQEKKKRSKWDVAAVDYNHGVPMQSNNGSIPPIIPQQTTDATQMARERALALAAKLTASGKQLPPPQEPPLQSNLQATTAPVSQYNLQQSSAILATEIKQTENGYLAEVEINDFPNRDDISSQATIRQVCQQSGASIFVRGSYVPENEKGIAISKGFRPLYLFVEAAIQAKIQVALHKLYDLSRIQSSSTRQLFDNTSQPAMQYVQDKVFVGLENVNHEFNIKGRLEGPNSSYLQHISTTTGAKAHLRGRGSGFAEATSGRESFEALHIYINHPRPDGLAAARNLCENLIQKIHNDYQMFNYPPSFQGPPPPQQMYSSNQQPMIHQLPPQARHPPPPMNNPPQFFNQPNQAYDNHYYNDRPRPSFDRDPRMCSPMPHSQDQPAVSYPTQLSYPGQIAPPMITMPHDMHPNVVGPRNTDHNPDVFPQNRHEDDYSDHSKHKTPPREKSKEKSPPPKRKRKFTEGPLLQARKINEENEEEVSSRRLDQRKSKDKSGYDGKSESRSVQQKTPSKIKDVAFKAPTLPPMMAGLKKGNKLPKSKKNNDRKPAVVKGALASLLSYGDDDASDSDSD